MFIHRHEVGECHRTNEHTSLENGRYSASGSWPLTIVHLHFENNGNLTSSCVSSLMISGYGLCLQTKQSMLSLFLFFF